MKLECTGLVVLMLGASGNIFGQAVSDSTYSRLNTFGVLSEYSNDSSHIILGNARNRKIGAIGFQYQRRLIHNNFLVFSYTAELRPAIIESDPTQTLNITQTSPVPFTATADLGAVVKCVAGSNAFNFTPPNQSPIVGVTIFTCRRRQVFAQGLSPLGLRLNLLPRHKIQPTLSLNGGYMFSTQQLPIATAGSFNFTFEFGAGLEIYQTHSKSARLEYVVQHFSNKDTGDQNPGVDSGFLKLTFSLGR